MDIAAYRQQAQRILAQRLVPGRDQEAIRASVDQLARITAELTSSGHPTAQGTLDDITQGLSELREKTTIMLLDPDLRHPVARAGLIELLYRLEGLRTTYDGAPQEQHLLVRRDSLDQEKRLHSLGVKTQDFRHIPYSWVSGHDIGALTEAIARNDIKAAPEKTYRVIPLKVRQEAPWNLTLIGADKAQQVARGTGIRVGIVDTGCDYRHEEIAERFTANKGYNFIADDEDPFDDNGHGTHVAGSVAGQAVGVAPNATLYALKFLDAGGFGSEIGFIRAAEWAIDNGLHVLNGSFGSSMPSQSEEAICDALQAQGILFVAAAGNDGTRRPGYPASYQSVISVAAVDREKQRAPFSQMNDQVEIAAPGVQVRSCVPDGLYDSFSGTSMATPHVAGSLALMREAGGDPNYLREALGHSAEELGPRDEYGSGLVRPDKALALDAFMRRWRAA